MRTQTTDDLMYYSQLLVVCFTYFFFIHYFFFIIFFIFVLLLCFFFNDTATTEIYTLSLHDALPILLILSSIIKYDYILLLFEIPNRNNVICCIIIGEQITMTIQRYSYIRKYLFIFSILFLFSSCDIVDTIIGSGKDDNTDTIINSTTIGTDGGVIKADDLTLSIPAGAFSKTVDINIYSSSVTDGSIDDLATKVYQIEGFPDQYSQPIDVSIKHNGNISEIGRAHV